MPGYDKSGPVGTGPMSGRGQGLCGTGQVGRNEREASLFERFAGRGRAAGFGGRGGFRRNVSGRVGRGMVGRFSDTSATGERGALRSEIEELRQSLAAIEQRLAGFTRDDE